MKKDELLTYQDLIEFERRVMCKIETLFSNKNHSSQYIRTAQLKKRLGGISDSQVQTLRIKGLLPNMKFGGMYLYDWEQIDANIQSTIKKGDQK